MSATIIKKGDFKFDASNREYQKFKQRIPGIIATNSVNHFKKGFTQGGKQTNDSLGGWESRQHRSGGNILVKRGILQRDIQKKRISFQSILIGTSNITANYAQIHNEGGTITITKKMRAYFWAQYKKTKDEYWKNLALHKGNTIKIPKREFIGDSNKLDNENFVLLKKGLDKVFNI